MQRPQEGSCVRLLDPTRLLIAPRSCRHFACDDHWLVIVVQFCLEVLALRLSCEGSSDRDGDRDIQTYRHTDRDRQTVACHPLCVASVPLPFWMSEWCEVTRPGMACAVWIASSRVAVRGVQAAVVPQQGHVPRLQQAERIRILESKVHQEEAAMTQAQRLGLKMDQARARCRRAVEPGETAMEAMQMAQENFEQAQQEVIQAQMDLDKLIQEAPLPVMPVPQVQCKLGQNFGSFDRHYRKHVETRRRATTRSPDTGNPGVEGNPSGLFGILSQEGGAALDAEQDPELWNLDEDEAEQMADFE